MLFNSGSFSRNLPVAMVMAILLIGCAKQRPQTNRQIVYQNPVAVPAVRNVQIPETLHKIELISEGMSKDEIKSVMGQPDSIEDMCCGKGKPKIWSYQGIKCFENEERPNVLSRFSGECEVHFDTQTNLVVGWDKKNSRVVVTQRQ